MFGGTLSAWPEKSDAELQVFVENLFLGVDVSELIASTSMLEPTEPKWLYATSTEPPSHARPK